MTQEIEIEAKNLLTKDEFLLLRENLDLSQKGKKQINYYFDSPNDVLKEHYTACRIREKNDTFTLTLKEPHPDGILETHDRLTQKEAENILEKGLAETKNVGKRLKEKGISIGNITCLGSLTTIRHEVIKEDITYVLDENTFNENVDYELEIEAPTYEQCQSAFSHILTSHKIPRRKTKTKIERFIESCHI